MKKLTRVLFFIVLLFMFTTNVFASNEVMLDASEDKVKLGGEITISIDLKMESKETSLYAYTAKLSYDKDVFDVIKIENFQEKENWSDITFNRLNNKFALINKKENTGKELIEIKLKVKEDAIPGKTTITVNNAKASDGNKDISLKSSSIDIMILKDGLEPNESTQVNKENSVSGEANAQGDFKWIAYVCIALMIAIIVFLMYYNVKNKDNEEMDDRRITITIISAVILVTLLIPTILLLCYKNTDDNKDGQENNDTNIIEYLLEIKNPEEEDNNNGNLTIGDVGTSTDQPEDQNHNTNANGSGNNNNNNNNNNNQSSTTKPSNPSNPTNSDQPSSPTNPNNPSNPTNPDQPSNPTNPDKPNNPTNPDQPSNPTNPDKPDNPSQPDNPQNPNEPSKPDDPNEPENPDESKVVITNKVISTLTPKKGEDIILNLYMDVTPSTEVEAVEIGGKFYNVERVNNSIIKLTNLLPINIRATSISKIAQENKRYTVKIPAPTEAKIHELNITKIKLNNDKEIEVNYSIIIDVLKDKPKVDGFKIDVEKEKPEISFNIEDTDGAFKDGTFIIKDEEGNEVYKSKPGEIRVGENKFTVELEDGKTYHYEFNIDYDLDHNYFSENLADDYENVEDFIDDSFGDGDGNLEFSRDYGFINKNMEITEKVSMQDDLILSFENDYDSYYDVRGVKIGDVEYPVQKDANGKYTVILPKGEKGKNSILIKSVILENDVSYDINEELQYIYLKEKPIINDANLQLENEKMHIELDITDLDESIKSVMVKVKDENGEVILEKLLEDMHSGDLEISNPGKYTVEVEVTYDLGDEILEKLINTYEAEIKEEIKEPIEANIVESVPTNYYVAKGEDIEITYTIEDNTDEDVKQIRIDGVAITVAKVEDGIYKVSLKAPTENIPQNRKISVEATEIIYESDSVEVVHSTEIEILKDEPSIIDIEFDDIAEIPTYKFKFNDPDDTLISGNIIIKNGEDLVGSPQELIVGENVLELPELTGGMTYTLEINGTYDLDGDKLDSINVHKLEDLFEKVELKIIDYVVGMNFEKIESINSESKELTILFTIENNTEFDVTHIKLGEQYYEVEKVEEKYKVTIPYNQENNENILAKISEVKLKNGKVVTLKQEVSIQLEASIVQSEVLNVYPNKGETITIKYTIKDNTNGKLTHIDINGEKIAVEESTDESTQKEDESVYSANYTVSSQAGKTALSANKLYYGDIEIQVELKEDQIEILKSIPSITELAVDDSEVSKQGKPKLNFVLNDEDDATIDGSIIIKRLDTNAEETIELQKDLKPQSYVLENIEEFVQYSIEIKVNYDLDAEVENEKNEGLITENHEFTVQANYYLLLEEFMIKEIADGKVILQFESTNKSSNDVEKALIGFNGENKQYEVTKGEDNLYTLEIPLSEFNEQRTELTLEEIILTNLKPFNRQTDKSVFDGIDTLVIFKNKPTAVIGNVILDEAKNLITVNNIEFTDNDSTLINKYAVLKLNGEVVQEVQMNEQTGVIFRAEDEMFEAGNYEIEILADYNINDGKEHTKEVISEKSTVKVDIVVEITKVSEKLYAEKNSIAVIEFSIKSNTKQDIESIEINNEAPQSFEKAENGNYKVTINLPSETGSKQYGITKINFENEEVTIENSPKVEVYVLKDKPTISDEVFDDISDETTYKFNFNDLEDTLISGNISVKDSEGHIEIEAQNLEKNENIVNLSSLARGKTYTLTISATYDLDDDKEDSINRETLNKEVELNIIDYKVSINIESIESINKQDKEVSIIFKVTNNTEFDVAYIKLREELYKVDKESDIHKVTIPYEQEADEKVSITISEVKMSNEKIISLEENATFDMFKKSPEATEPQITFEDAKIKASFTITDEDSTIKELHAELKDVSGSSIGSEKIEDISAGEKQVEFDNSLAGRYKVEVVADYDKVDGEEHNDIVLNEAENTREIIASISEAEILNKYPEKGATIKIKYTVKDNTYEKVTAMEINGERNETVEEESEDVYTVSYTVPSESGEHTISVSNLYYGEDEATAEKEDKVEVLKSALYVDAINIDDSKVVQKTGNPVLNFHIHDEDKTFVSGSVSIKDDKNSEVQNITINKDDSGNKERSYELQDIQEFKTYKVEITVNYDLDEDNENSLNEGTITENSEFIIENNYDLKISDLQFKEGETGKVILQFKSTNNSSHIINKVLIGLNGEETKQYDASKGEDDLYTVEILLNELHNEKTTLTLAGVILDNLKDFKKETDNELFESLSSFEVFKDKPTAEVGEVTVSEDKKSIIANNISFTDEDTTITNKYIVLKLGEEEVSKTKISNEAKITFSVEGDKPFKAGTYSIGILASYNVIDGNIHEEELISEEKQVEVGIVANVTGASDKVFAHKETNAVITFTIESNTEQEIGSMLVNGNQPVSFEKNESGNYEVTVTTPTEKGEKEYEITKLTYGDTEINLQDTPKAKVYVLKDTPTIIKDEFDDISDIPTYKFTFNDPDNTLISGNIVVKDEEGSPVIDSQSLNANVENVVTLSELTRGKVYTLSLEGTYDLDDLEEEQSNIHNLEEILKDVKLNIIDYEIYLDFNKVEAIDEVQKNVTVSFRVRNNTEFEVSYVKLNEEYAMQKEGELYKVTIPYEQVNDEKVKITISEVKMSNGKKVELKAPAEFEILKKAPSASKPTLSKTEEDIITAQFEITDVDNTITSIHAELRKGEVVVESKEIEKIATEVTFAYNRAGTCKVVIVASYDRADAQEHIDEEISEKSEDITIDIKASISSSILSTKYPNQNVYMEITYTITDNTDEEITAIDMTAGEDTTKYENEKLIKESDDVYTIVYRTPGNPGIVNLKAIKLYYGEVEIEADKPDSIDVLKRKPYIKYNDEDFKIFYDYNKSTVSVIFKTVDPDNATLNDENGQPQKGMVSYAGFLDEKNDPKPTFTMGETTSITFKDVPKNRVYLIHIYSAPYDLDSNPEDNENHYDKHYDSSLLLIRCGAFVGMPSELNVDNLKVKTANEEETTQLKVNEQFKISFTADVIPLEPKYGNEYHAEYIRIKGEETEHERTYRLEKDDKTYTTRDYIKGFDTAGPRNIEIESIILSNGEIIPMEDTKITIQVLQEDS